MVHIMQTLIGRPYGWGGLNFNNDCSQELKSLFAAFGIWLPRHSSAQASPATYNWNGQSADNILANLKNKTLTPFFSIAYVKGHVVLWLGEHNNPQSSEQVWPMSYQMPWGLAPADRSYREVIGQSALLPLLKQFPEYPEGATWISSGTFEVRDFAQTQTTFNAGNTLTPSIMMK